MMTARSAVQFSLWLAVNHPDVFNEMLRRASAGTRAGFAGLGDDFTDVEPVEVTATYSDGSTPSYASYDYSPAFDELSTVDVTPQFIDAGGNVIDQATAEQMFNLPAPPPALVVSAPTLEPVQLDPQAIQTAVNDPTITQIDPGPSTSSTGSGSFLSALGNGLASAATALFKSAGTVAQSLTNPNSIKALAGVAQSYFTSQAQSTALQTQLARANAGLSPAPITYTYGPNGQLIPVMANPQTGTIAYNAQGQPYYVTPQTAAGLMPGATVGSLSTLVTQITPYLPYILGGAALLFFFGGGRAEPARASAPRRYRPRHTRGPRR